MIVSYSHGPDSRYLLEVLLKDFHDPGSIVLVYFDHGLRPEAQHEIASIRALAAEKGVKCCIRKLPVKAYQTKYGVSFEAASHRLRKSFLIHFSKLFGIKEVYLAHHLDDDIETMMLKLFRGTGTQWKPFLPRLDAYGVTWCRPLLHMSKTDILTYLNDNGITYSIDDTNSDVTYTRNWVRHEFLPLASRINTDYRGALTGFFNVQRDQALAISLDIDAITDKLHFANGFIELKRDAYEGIYPVLVPYLVMRIFELAWLHFYGRQRILPPYWGIMSVHVKALCDALMGKVSGRFSLPLDMVCEWNRHSIAVFNPKQLPEFFAEELILDCPLVLPSLGLKLVFERGLSTPDLGVSLRLPVTTDKLTVRPYIEGDRYYPKGASLYRCVWKLMKSRHILPFKRDSLPLFFYEHQLLWAPGLVCVDEGELRLDESTVLGDYTISVFTL